MSQERLEDVSTPRLLAGLIVDVGQLLDSALTLATAEVGQNVARAGHAVLALMAAAALLAGSLGLLAVGLSLGLASFAGWPAWVGLAVVGGLGSLTGFGLTMVARQRTRRIALAPDSALASMRDTGEWLRHRIDGMG
jgi:hypothetical protein